MKLVKNSSQKRRLMKEVNKWLMNIMSFINKNNPRTIKLDHMLSNPLNQKRKKKLQSKILPCISSTRKSIISSKY